MAPASRRCYPGRQFFNPRTPALFALRTAASLFAQWTAAARFAQWIAATLYAQWTAAALGCSLWTAAAPGCLRPLSLYGRGLG